MAWTGRPGISGKKRVTIYKYVSSHSGLHYLVNWRLRLSPASALNDPFEFELVVSERYENAFRAQLEVLYTQLDREADRTREERLAQWKRSEEAAPERQRASLAEAMTEAYKASLGVLCLTRTQRHLLMWSHYAEGHRGMLLEFDDENACFRRNVPGTEFQGRLIPVTYSDSRPPVTSGTADAIARCLTSKALEWAYEQEVRMFLPLSAADPPVTVEANGTPLHLIDIPPVALRSVTLGCLSNDKEKVVQALRGTADHVIIRASSIDIREYRLHYNQQA
jgi:hypothetical protein